MIKKFFAVMLVLLSVVSFDQARTVSADFGNWVEEPGAVEANFLKFVDWLPPDWDYRKSHIINGSTVGLLTNYPIRIVVHYGSGIDSGEDVYLYNSSRSDFGDVRFTGSDGSTQLDYWIEERTDGNYAVFWVEVDRIDASPGSGTVYIYYGNNAATTTSNGKNTFDWFDDFYWDSSVDYEIGRHATV